jgi:phage shock protein A
LELGKVSQSAKDISTLQQNLKEKDKIIDKIKTTGSSLKTMLSSTQQKIEELKAEKVTLSKELQTSQGQLRNLKSFTVPQLELDESSM